MITFSIKEEDLFEINLQRTRNNSEGHVLKYKCLFWVILDFRCKNRAVGKV